MIAFCLTIGLGVVALYGTTYLSQQLTQNPTSHVKPTASFGLSNGQGAYFFGNTATNNGGWKMPVNTPVSTSFTTTHALNGFLSATIYIIPYEISPNTQLHLGLYINGTLVANNTVNVSESRAPVASIIGQARNISSGEVANFTKSLQGYQVFSPIPRPLAAGAIIDIIAYASSPIWIQTAQVASGHSYEMNRVSTLPKSLPNLSISTAVPDLCIGGESNEA